MKFDIKAIIALVRGLIPVIGTNVNDHVQRLVTVPKTDRLKLYAGMSEGDIAEAERLHELRADADADWIVFVASRGTIEPD